MEQKDLQHIAGQFAIEGNVVEVRPLGNGLINTTYKVVTEGNAPDYVMQHINTAIFPDVDMLMDNITAVTAHIRKKLEAKNTADIDRKVLKFVPCNDGKYYYKHEGKYWRIMVFIPDTVSKTGVTPESSYIVGETFGDFQAMLADIPVQLGETIKDFHNIEFRLQQFHDAVKADKVGRAAGVKDIIDEIEKRAGRQHPLRQERRRVVRNRPRHRDAQLHLLRLRRLPPFSRQHAGRGQPRIRQDSLPHGYLQVVHRGISENSARIPHAR